MTGPAAAFLDRDGVLIEEVGHLHRAEDVRLVPGAAAAVRRLRAAGYRVIVITNQSAVARGLLTEEALERIHEHLRAELARDGAVIDDLLYCPHHPTEGQGAYRIECACRKPAAGLLLEAQRRHGLDLGRSVLIGDKRSDLGAARRAGCRGVLVRTGHGAAEEARLPAEERPPVYGDLWEAACALAP